MASQARPGIKRREAEGLGLGGLDDFPDVNPHTQAKQLQLVDQSDVHAPVNVFQKLGHFGGAGRADQVDLVEDSLIEGLGCQGACGIHSADDLRRLVRLELLVAGVFALGRKSQQELGRDRIGGKNRPSVGRVGRNGTAQPGPLKNRKHHLFGGSRIRRAFEDHQLSRDQAFANLLGRIANIRNVRLTVVVANLEARKMKFGVSEGMVLAASGDGSGIFLVSPDPGASPGMRVK